MSDVVLQADHLGKRYVVRQAATAPDSLREQLTLVATRTIGRLIGYRGRSKHLTPSAPTAEFWALRDICLTIRQGDVLGIIGRNGAGKSTLLKIISRITEPTEGSLTLRGRVASLLEIGTGFHHELTGRENIFLNGAVLGMTRAELRRKFDQIVAFADIGEFLDTPVKRYSSGMYVRLAFSVAAHLDPEILIVDEVLAVGDEVFQRKCIERMSEVAREGRTVLFVSHNLSLIRLLCKRGVVVSKSHLVFDGTAGEAVAHYLSSIDEQNISSSSLSLRIHREGSGESILTRIELRSADNAELTSMACGMSARLVFHASVYVPGMFCQFTIFNAFGQPIASFDSSAQPYDDETGQNPIFICELEGITLIPGRYRITAGLYVGVEQLDHLDAAFVFDVEPSALLDTRNVNPADGSVVLPHRWIPAR